MLLPFISNDLTFLSLLLSILSICKNERKNSTFSLQRNENTYIRLQRNSILVNTFRIGEENVFLSFMKHCSLAMVPFVLQKHQTKKNSYISVIVFAFALPRASAIFRCNSIFSKRCFALSSRYRSMADGGLSSKIKESDRLYLIRTNDLNLCVFRDHIGD